MVIYKCKCGDELAVTENTGRSMDKKRAWKDKHGAPLIAKSPRRKVADRGSAGIHGYVRNVTRKSRKGILNLR